MCWYFRQMLMCFNLALLKVKTIVGKGQNCRLKLPSQEDLCACVSKLLAMPNSL